MCGIVGALSFGPAAPPIEKDFIDRLRDAMVHRGPDGAGTWVSEDGRLGLGHRRLSIIDLSELASQPMWDAEKEICIVFNGEIYNHAELRQELKAAGGGSWNTDHSDTETVIRAYRLWGIDCLHRFVGMFAFALWDSRSRELFLVRDRIGIKPLYYTRRDGQLLFASEIKALLADPRQPRRLNESAVGHYLSFLTTPAPQTLFDGIQKLPPGTWMRVSADGATRSERYWEPLRYVQPRPDIDGAEASAELLRILRKAVSYRGVSDVPVGVFLSGGIDSSTNAALFSEDRAEPVSTYSIGYSQDYGSYKNELHYARMMAERLGSRHREKLLEVDDLLGFLPEMVWLQDEPIGDPVCIPVYYVSQLARQDGSIVCQVGEGADELFWGYPLWRTKLWLARLDALPVPRILKAMLLPLLGMKTTGRMPLLYETLRRSVAGQPIFWGGVDAFTEAQKMEMLSPRMKQVYSSATTWEAVIEPLWKRYNELAWEKGALGWMSFFDLSIRLPELLLMRVDKMSMGVSLEARVPFLDHNVVDFAFSLPEALKTRNNELKHVLKRSVRGLIPDELIDRKKQGFGVPVHEWFVGKLGDFTRRELKHFCDTTDILDYSKVREMMDLKLGSKLWFLLNLALWHRQTIEGHSIQDSLEQLSLG